MSTSDQHWPPKYLGDYPRGVYWSAERPATSVDDDALDFTVEGDVIRFMWDYGVVVPLWDGNGLVPEEHEWLRSALGISDALISDLREWGNDMNHLDANPSPRTEDVSLIATSTDVRGPWSSPDVEIAAPERGRAVGLEVKTQRARNWVEYGRTLPKKQVDGQ